MKVGVEPHLIVMIVSLCLLHLALYQSRTQRSWDKELPSWKCFVIKNILPSSKYFTNKNFCYPEIIATKSKLDHMEEGKLDNIAEKAMH